MDNNIDHRIDFDVADRVITTYYPDAVTAGIAYNQLLYSGKFDRIVQYYGCTVVRSHPTTHCSCSCKIK